MKVYLAGPEVFLQDAPRIGRRKVALCAQYGFEGLFPLDNEISSDAIGASRQIFDGNIEMIRSCHAVIANLSPFRGISADPGTAFEIGAGYALRKIVMGYSAVPGELKDRAATALGTGADKLLADGMHVEDFGLFDNLMLAEAVAASGFKVFHPSAPLADPWRDLSLFEACLRALAYARMSGAVGAA